jgi:hypothetical protein
VTTSRSIVKPFSVRVRVESTEALRPSKPVRSTLRVEVPASLSRLTSTLRVAVSPLAFVTVVSRE